MIVTVTLIAVGVALLAYGAWEVFGRFSEAFVWIILQKDLIVQKKEPIPTPNIVPGWVMSAVGLFCILMAFVL